MAGPSRRSLRHIVAIMASLGFPSSRDRRGPSVCARRFKIRILVLVICMTGLVPIAWLKTSRSQNRSSPRCWSCTAPEAANNAHFEIFNSTAQVKLSFADSLGNICRESLAPVHYVIAVSSLPTATHLRNIIRADLWYTRNASSSVKLIFFTGRPSNLSLLAHLERERHLHADIVLGNYSGVPESAPLATLVLLRWVAEFCTAAPFVIKITDQGRVNARFLQASYELNVKLADEFDMLGSFVSLHGEACSEPPCTALREAMPGPWWLSFRMCVHADTKSRATTSQSLRDSSASSSRRRVRYRNIGRGHWREERRTSKL
ncbi:hypothetical protein MTO96_006577 [Rhipicephalus appendiculatus]